MMKIFLQTSLKKCLAVMVALAAAPIQAHAADDEGLLVIYGAQSPTREGDVDNREQIFFSVPASTEGRFYVRLFDPETFGSDDFIYAGSGDAVTTFRVFGGEGAYSAADRPVAVEDLAAASDDVPDFPVTGPGRMVNERVFDSDRATDGRWVTLGTLTARQGNPSATGCTSGSTSRAPGATTETAIRLA
ncbi:hypothetical protein [Sulfitobacter aestuariivivens]|uniref:hypothetical protein n=1 Tax=Sulfitobacter aestuariivivens TaxID=2766981 RepID=UPI00361549B1